QTQKATLEHIDTIGYYESAGYLVLDPATIRNLELIESMAGESKDTLLGVLSKTHTGMGARLLRNWMLRPSVDAAEIEARFNAVDELAGSVQSMDAVGRAFEGIFDLERLLSKITLGTAGPRELNAFRSSIGRLPGLGRAASTLKSPRIQTLYTRLDL